MKKIALIPILAVFSSGAVDYKTFSNAVRITPTEVNITILQIDEEEPACLEEGISFPLGEQFSSAWLDTVVLSRQQQQLLNFSFDENTCLVNAITMPILYDEGSGNAVSGDLDETGINGNVALIGTNGLESDSFNASLHYNSDQALAAFDGYIYTQHFNEDSEEKIARGIWLTEMWDHDGERVSPWVEIDYGFSVSLSGLGIFINPQSLRLGRLPRFVTVLSSDDGVEYDEVVSYTLSNQEGNRFNFTSELSTQYIKLRFENNFGDGKFIEIDEIELYQ